MEASSIYVQKILDNPTFRTAFKMRQWSDWIVKDRRRNGRLEASSTREALVTRSRSKALETSTASRIFISRHARPPNRSDALAKLPGNAYYLDVEVRISGLAHSMVVRTNRRRPSKFGGNVGRAWFSASILKRDDLLREFRK